jgi:glycosyltransferase involved in cell wall biosynthesis
LACDLVALTSRSEGIPLVLMEAMAYGKTVLAPAITGIPELVINGRTGFLYTSGSLQDFVTRVEEIIESGKALARVGKAARQHVIEKFNREKNLAAFAELFLRQVTGDTKGKAHEDFVLQQI